jgi:hypothetical protein
MGAVVSEKAIKGRKPCKKTKVLPLPEPGDRLLFIRFSSLDDVLLATKGAKVLINPFPFLAITWLGHLQL